MSYIILLMLTFQHKTLKHQIDSITTWAKQHCHESSSISSEIPQFNTSFLIYMMPSSPDCHSPCCS